MEQENLLIYLLDAWLYLVRIVLFFAETFLDSCLSFFVSIDKEKRTKNKGLVGLSSNSFDLSPTRKFMRIVLAAAGQFFHFCGS